MSFQPILSDAFSLSGEVKMHLSYKNLFIDPEKTAVDDSHVHGSYEIYINLSGEVYFLHSDKLYSIESGDVIFSEPGEVHHCIYQKPCIHEHYCLWFEVSDGTPLSVFLKKNRISGRVRLDREKKERLLTLVSELKNVREEFEKSVIFLNVLCLLKDAEGREAEENKTLPGKMQTILEYLNERFLEINSVGAIAEHLHVSIPTVNRWFREYLHLSPGEFIRAKRLSYAEKLLREEASVTEACYKAGFTDCSRFIRLFRHNYGKTPFQYKKALASDG